LKVLIRKSKVFIKQSRRERPNSRSKKPGICRLLSPIRVSSRGWKSSFYRRRRNFRG